ncbi:MAG: FAD-binding oxidoreductase [Phycisphaeraceae bacterium]
MDASLANARLIARSDLNADLCIVRIAPDSGQVPAFEPGQFATLGLPESDEAPGRLVRRPYSIASSPDARDHIELLLARVKEGHFTSRFWPLRPGSPIWLDPHIHGRFTLAAVPPDADLVMVATGTGIAPFMSMLRT